MRTVKCKVIITYCKVIVKKCTEMILSAKNERMLRMSKKINHPSTSPKSYWSVLNWFLNNKNIPSIPLIFHNGKVISDFNEKANLFNSFFASQCTSASKSSVLPDISSQTNALLNSFSITEKDILAIIKLLDPSKSHGWDNISIKTIKMCGESFSLPLKMIFEAALNDGAFQMIERKVIL